jgi:hypothetical protein
VFTEGIRAIRVLKNIAIFNYIFLHTDASKHGLTLIFIDNEKIKILMVFKIVVKPNLKLLTLNNDQNA